MSAAAIPRMSADDFILWAKRQPGRPRYELVDGEVLARTPERAIHAETEFRAIQALDGAIRALVLPCQAYVDGLSVRVSDCTVYEPDALVQCGDRLDSDTVVITDPVIAVEVTSPSIASIDADAKLDEYFRLPSESENLSVILADDTICSVVIAFTNTSYGVPATEFRLIFTLSVRHSLIVKPKTRTVIHHVRDAEGAIRTHIRTEGALTLDPPGITVTLDALLP
jgi:hypothetical protein